MILDDHFDRIAIICMPGREGRALAELKEKGLSDKAVEVEAVDGGVFPPPKWFKAGGGAWGCLQSHVRVIQAALEADVEQLLILEDDVTWQRNPVPLVREFMEQLPDSWQQVYFGGQHRTRWRPRPVGGKPAVYRLRSVHRTHAYGLKREIFAKVLQHILHAPDYINQVSRGDKPSHVDHQLEVAQRRGDWKVFGPSWWLAGQAENESRIRRRLEPERWWQWVAAPGWLEKMPLVLATEPGAEAVMKRLHFGRHLDPENPTIDTGLAAHERRAPIMRTLQQIAGEAIADQKLPAAHASDRILEVAESWRGGVIRLEDLTAEEAAELADPRRRPRFYHRWLNPPPRIKASRKAKDLPVFVFSAPRSGSTLVMRILNQTPGVGFSGETRGFFWKLQKMHAERDNLLQQFPGADDPLDRQLGQGAFPAWLQNSTEAGWTDAIRGLARAWAGGGERAWGWKEVTEGRHGHGFELYQWIHRIMPDALLVFLLRPVEEIMPSMMGRRGDFIPIFADCPAGCERKVREQHRSFREYAEENPEGCRMLDYREVLEDFPGWSREHLGLEIPEEVWRKQLEIRVK